MYVPGGAGAEGLVEVKTTLLLDGSWFGPSKCMCMWVRSILVAQERVKIAEQVDGLSAVDTGESLFT